MVAYTATADLTNCKEDSGTVKIIDALLTPAISKGNFPRVLHGRLAIAFQTTTLRLLVMTTKVSSSTPVTDLEV